MNQKDRFEELKQFLPQYLPQQAQESLYQNLTQFPDNIDSRLYTSELDSKADFYQGDGIRGMPFIKLPDSRIGRQPAILLSNTCDMARENKRLLNLRVTYAPIHRLEKYEAALLSHSSAVEQQVRDHVASIRKQLVSHLFFLPRSSSGLPYEGIVRLDTIQNASIGELSSNSIQKDRLFCLSNYGFYVFLLKLSYHFTRIGESLDRTRNQS